MVRVQPPPRTNCILTAWKGPIIHIRLFGLPVLILSSSPVAKELLETRHQKYSGRPNFLLVSLFIGNILERRPYLKSG